MNRGFCIGAGVTVNINSAKALNSVVGHEVTHVFEGSGQYDALMAAMKELAAESGIDWDAKLQEAKERYKNVKNADPEKELLADMVGEYLFTDSGFVKSLSTKNPGLFKRIYEEIKYLAKTFAGTKQGAALEKVKKTFAEIYRDANVKNTAQTDGVKYTLADIDFPRKVIDYKDITARRAAEDEAVDGLVRRGKTTIIKKVDIPPELADVNWSDRTESRDAINEILKDFLGEDVVFNLGDESAIAYLTAKGLDHTLAGHNTADKAIALSAFYRLISNAEYSYSGLKDQHSKTTGRENWDYFVSVAQIEGGNTVPIVFAVRSIDQDVRSQIYSIATKENLTIPRGDGTQGKPANAHPSYGDSSSSNDIVEQDNQNVNGKFSLSETKDAAQAGEYRIIGEDIALAPTREDIARMERERIATAQNAPRNDVEELGAPTREDIARMEREQNVAGNDGHISLEDYANNESPVWRNVPYEDEVTKKSIMQDVHNAMVAEGAVVRVSDAVDEAVNQAYPDLRDMKKKERVPILKNAMNKLKNDIRQFLNGFKNQNFEFEVNGKVLEARLYNTGIDEVMEKVTQEKAKMLYSTEGIFKNARYLYSTPDYDGDPNVYRWNYFYTPVQIGDETVGVRIAVRDVATPRESQIYNWGIKKDASLDGVGRGTNNRISHGVSSDASTNNIPENGSGVKYSVGEPVAEDLGAPTSEDIARAEAMQAEAEKELHGPWRMTDPLDQKVEKLFRMMLREEVSEQDYMAQLVKADRQYQQRGGRVEEALERVREAYSKEATATAEIEKKVERLTRKVLHEGIMGRMKDALAEKKPRFDVNRGVLYLLNPNRAKCFRAEAGCGKFRG